MLLNFCDPRLRPEIQCSTVSTEGYEVNNLISDSDKGFLAYACIKPPVNIDITFLCNIHINHILIWPCVGSQKSSGFQLYAKTSNDTSVPYGLLAAGFLDHSNAGLLFYPSDVNHETIAAPPNFLKRYIKPSLRYLATYMSNLRICVCKTENSVPALGKIEVWGTVSPRCGKDTVASIYTLWSKQHTFVCETAGKSETTSPPVTVVNSREEKLESSLPVPESFLDAITWEIMTQPILLPSGKIVDQSTLQKHEETEALWGRRLTDPFTGIPFSEDRKPVIASALKMRIDKFLLENSNSEEIKKLPRVLGRATPSTVTEAKISEIPKYLLKENISNGSNDVKPKLHYSTTNAQQNKKFCHKLPAAVMSHKQTASTVVKPTKRRKTIDSSVQIHENSETPARNDNCTEVVDLNINNTTNVDVSAILANLKRFDSVAEKNDAVTKINSCACCTDGVFYQLPCKHVLCRKVLISIQNNQCTSCSMSYKNGEVKRLHE